MAALNATHDATRRSWVASANDGQTDFPIQNLPFAVFRRRGSREALRGGVAIGDQILDLAAAHARGAFSGIAARAAMAAAGDTLNALMALGPEAWSALRAALSDVLQSGAPQEALLRDALVAQADAEFALPAHIGDYTDFYTSVHHATNVGRLFRPDNPLLPNYKWVPIGYHGRASSVIVSGQPFHRPIGQSMPAGATAPVVGPSRRLDYELELGIFIGRGNALGERIAMANAESHVFGLCLLNDWSARDIQPWEYQPLGPFLAKNFATTISPWIVTLEALAPYRTAWSRPAGDPEPLPYLDAPTLRSEGAIDIQLEVTLQSARMRESGLAPHRLCRTSYRHAYWTLAQLVTHHTVNGCNLQSGDLLGTGTLSGPAADEMGALLELTAGGKQPVTLPDGEQRTFIEDGDRVALHGHCAAPGFVRLGFGACEATLLPART
ncbi:MAG: fumarylacetoacetase [Burkholderiales bacterium]|nr:fumarylacetoacetase [Burkholderiales bacterium]